MLAAMEIIDPIMAIFVPTPDTIHHKYYRVDTFVSDCLGCSFGYGDNFNWRGGGGVEEKEEGASSYHILLNLLIEICRNTRQRNYIGKNRYKNSKTSRNEKGVKKLIVIRKL